MAIRYTKEDTKKAWGIVQDIQKKERLKAIKKYAKKQYDYSTGEKKRPPIISRKQLTSSLASIGNQVRRESNQFDRFRSRAPGTTSRSIVEPRRSPMNMNNFFEHKEEYEVYGDEGLTFFDSNKSSRSSKRTGELFGI